ncbi:dihydrolipoyl dehydrogenase family protein [Chachezhania antarctica]|uniref:dihydrolipoyl dehydrogenase family protein n=1 Tax=Chachezhania antarctica TaxID=2340860 RepID=UPI000EB3D7C3|nr:FAD-dependent oxidoreductase [Chachezhania antarctica]|tara:strand:+ start:426 stop:1847 length:1422 start_codon:yes stop_codon:yes gene_type:complete
MASLSCDILVIGAGSGGLSVASGASQMGADVILLEAGEMGGDCLNAGCVPSKSLIAAAAAAQAQRTSAPFGVTASEPVVDYAAVQAHVADVIATIAPVDSQERFEGLGVRVIRDWGRFVSKSQVEVGGDTITARRIVVATGSTPVVPPIEGLKDVPYLTSDTLWGLRTLPDHLLILGGGPIGMEMAQAHARLGAKVTVVDAGPALNREDPEAAALVLQAVKADGVTIRDNTGVKKITGTEGRIEMEIGDNGETLTGSHILVATGRRAAVERLNLDAAGIETENDAIKVDDRLRTTNRRVYAIGDVAGQGAFTHLAGYHAGVVIRSIVFGLPAKVRTDHIPRATYTDPELAQIGLTEAEARDRYGDKVDIARFDLSHNDRAIAQRRTTGFIKAMVHKGRPVGATIVCAEAGEHANFWALALANKLKMSQISATVSPYPTAGEIGKRVAGAYFSPRLFESRTVKTVVGLVQRWLP